MVIILYKEFLKWQASLSISLSRSLTYKLNFLSMMTVPVLIFFAIKYSLWSSIYAVNPQQEIQGYTLSRMIEYQFWILIFDLFIRSYFFSQNVSSDIRLGKISSFLIYPFSFLAYQFNLFLSDKVLQFVIALSCLILVLSLGWIDLPSFSRLSKAFALILTVALYWFFIQMIIGFLSFWLDETWSLNVAIRFISAFFSGSILPLDFFPSFLSQILYWTPFPYLVYLPISLLMGEDIDFLRCFVILCCWTFCFFLISKIIWKKGLKLYTAAGI